MLVGFIFFSFLMTYNNQINCFPFQTFSSIISFLGVPLPSVKLEIHHHIILKASQVQICEASKMYSLHLNLLLLDQKNQHLPQPLLTKKEYV